MKCSACNYEHFKTDKEIIEGDEEFKMVMQTPEIVFKTCPKCKTIRCE